MNIQHHEARRDTYRWHVVTSGPDDKPPVLLLHCWSGNWQLWEPTMRHFDGQYRFIAPDHLGFGQSDKPDGDQYGIDLQAERAHFILNHFGYRQAMVIGHSMGGQIALTMAGLFPASISRLVVVDPAVTGKVHPLAHLATPLLILARNGITFPLKATVALGLRFPPIGLLTLLTYFPNPWKQRAAAMYWGGQLIADGQAVSGAWAASAVWRWDVTPLLRHIIAPTLAIWGAKDWNVPVSECKVLESQISDFRYVLIPEVGHFPMIEAFGAYVAPIAEFLQQGIVNAEPVPTR